MENKKQEIGVKYDDGKTRYDLVEWRFVEGIGDILTLGAKKYAPDNWKKVPDFKRRYIAAFFRHMISWVKGDRVDSESGKSHLLHAACCLMFLYWNELEDNNLQESTQEVIDKE